MDAVATLKSSFVGFRITRKTASVECPIFLSLARSVKSGGALAHA